MRTCETCGFKFSQYADLCPLCDQTKAVGRWETVMYITGIATVISAAFFWLLLWAVVLTAPVFVICIVGTLNARQRKLELMLEKMMQRMEQKEEKAND